MLENEEFKRIYINGKKSNYVISNYGRCFNTKRKKFLKELPRRTHKTKMGLDDPNNIYYSYTLYSGGNKVYYSIHRLVCMYFIPIPKKYSDMGLTMEDLEVDHIDAIKFHNHVSNLQWLTKEENYQKMIDDGLARYATGENHGLCNLSNEQILKVCDLLVDNELTQHEISVLTNVPYKTVNKIYKRKAFVALSDSYDFSHYDKFMKTSIDEGRIRKALELLSTGKYSAREVASLVFINYNSLKSIIQGKSRKGIREEYDLTKFYERKVITNENK